MKQVHITALHFHDVFEFLIICMAFLCQSLLDVFFHASGFHKCSNWLVILIFTAVQFIFGP